MHPTCMHPTPLAQPPTHPPTTQPQADAPYGYACNGTFLASMACSSGVKMAHAARSSSRRTKCCWSPLCVVGVVERAWTGGGQRVCVGGCLGLRCGQRRCSQSGGGTKVGAQRPRQKPAPATQECLPLPDAVEDEALVGIGDDNVLRPGGWMAGGGEGQGEGGGGGRPRPWEEGDGDGSSCTHTMLLPLTDCKHPRAQFMMPLLPVSPRPPLSS